MGELFFITIPSYSEGDLCKGQSALTTGASLSSFFWTMNIALFLYISIVQNRKTLANRLIPFFHIVGWGLPILIVSLGLGYNALGYDTFSGQQVGWCWVRSGDNIPEDCTLFWRIFAGKGWEILSYIVTFFLYIRIKFFLRKKTSNRDEGNNSLNSTLSEKDPLVLQKSNDLGKKSRDALHQADKKLILIPVVFVFIRIWSTLRFCIRASQEFYWLALISGVGDSLQGFVDCIIFCFLTRKIRHKLFPFLRKDSVN